MIKLKAASTSSMSTFYEICFWISLTAVGLFSVFALALGKSDLIKDFALPAAASIFAFGQLWQREKQIQFERTEHFKKNYFELIGMLNDAFKFEADLSNADFGAKFSEQCLKQMHQMTLFNEKAVLLFGDTIKKDIVALSGAVKAKMENMCEVTLNARYYLKTKDSKAAECQKQQNILFVQLDADAQKLIAFMHKLYDEKMANFD
ncbi:MAG: hypothetical protein FWG39_01875 [Alphaproteobacteria bacterium]|nr:hypothetical protein [Alphaproteobacteria bacterium]